MDNEKQIIKLNESQLRQCIQEAINEFRGTNYGEFDGDVRYVRPNGKPWISNDDFKTVHNAPSIGDKRGKRSIDRGHDRSHNMFSYGKGNLCFQLQKNLCDLFQIECNGFSAKPTGKINWTPDELKHIIDIYNNILSLASLSKKEGARTRNQIPNAAEE